MEIRNRRNIIHYNYFLSILSQKDIVLKYVAILSKIDFPLKISNLVAPPD